MAKQTLGFRVDPDVIEELDRIAEITGESRSEVAERALTMGIVAMLKVGKVLQNPVLGNVVLGLIKLDSFREDMTEAELEVVRRWVKSGGRVGREARRGEA